MLCARMTLGGIWPHQPHTCCRWHLYTWYLSRHNLPWYWFWRVTQREQNQDVIAGLSPPWEEASSTLHCHVVVDDGKFERIALGGDHMQTMNITMSPTEGGSISCCWSPYCYCQEGSSHVRHSSPPPVMNILSQWEPSPTQVECSCRPSCYPSFYILFTKYRKEIIVQRQWLPARLLRKEFRYRFFYALRY